MLAFGQNFASVSESLPSVRKEIMNLHRQYIANVIYTRLGDAFSRWVDERVNARHKRVADERNLNIELDPEIAEIFRNSNAISGKLY